MGSHEAPDKEEHARVFDQKEKFQVQNRRSTEKFQKMNPPRNGRGGTRGGKKLRKK